MNKQIKPDGKGRGIEWTNYTWNPVKGCLHGCRWQMPDGSTAICYAESVANGVARAAYPKGFASHYFAPKVLDEPLKLKETARIFLDSMSDLMGHWVPEDEVKRVLEVCRQADWHTFQLLTKAAPRLLRFTFPPNVWVGASLPPSTFMGKNLSVNQQRAMFETTLKVLTKVAAPVRWVSFEPLSVDFSDLVAEYPNAIKWAVIGAGSNGKKTYQPKKIWVENLLRVLDRQNVPVFFKGNLAWRPWREEYPLMEHKRWGIEINPTPSPYPLAGEGDKTETVSQVSMF